jgi:uncharacterized protein with beta-barrel porin domain
VKTHNTRKATNGGRRAVARALSHLLTPGAIAVVMLAAGASIASADCIIVAHPPGPATVNGNITNSGAGECIFVQNTNVNGSIINSGTLTATTAGSLGITYAGSTTLGDPSVTLTGMIVNNGTVNANNGIVVSSSLGGASFGGIINNGTVAGTGAGSTGISLLSVASSGGGPVSIVNTGAVSGTIGISSAGSSPVSIFNSGTIAGSGGNAIDLHLDSGIDTLTIAPSSNVSGTVLGNGHDVFALGGSGSGNFDLSTVGSSAQYQGFTTFNVVGGTWTVANTSTQSQSWNVLGGTLAGTGTVSGVNVSAGGTLAPGTIGSPGTSMTVTGNLALASGAIYLVTVGGSNASFANVGGTASLGGSTLTVDILSAPTINKPVLILQTTGGIQGAFAPPTVVTQNFRAQVSYSADDAFLTFTADLHNQPLPGPGGGNVSGCGQGWTVNQCGMAVSLDNYFNNGGALTAPFATVFGLSGSALGTALFQLDGENATGAERAAFQLTNQFLTLMLDPFVDGRMGGFNSAGGAIGFAPEQMNNLPPDVALAYASILNKNPASGAGLGRGSFEQRWTMWGGAFGGSSNTRGDQNVVGSSNVTANTFGFAAGADYHVSPETTVGFALAGGGTSWGLANGLGTGRSDALQAGVYGIHWFGPAYVGGALSFSNHWFTTSRTALGDGLGANFAGQSYGARFEGGYRFAALPTLGVTPYGAVQLQDFHTAAYNESDSIAGGYALAYPSQNATDVRTEIGSRFDAPTLVYGMPLIWRGRLAWAHDFVNNPALNPAFESLPGASFTVYGAPFPHDSALTSAGAELFLTPRWTLLAKFDGEFAGNAQTYAGSGTLRYVW